MATSRRGFLGRFFGKKAFVKACFAVQVVIDVGQDTELRRRLHSAMDQDAETPAQKRRLYKGLTGVLREAEPFYEYASFSYQDDPAEADGEYREWVSEIEANMSTEAVETGDDVDGYHRMSAEKKYLVVSLIFLLSRPHPWHDDLDDEDDDTYTRPYIGELIDSVNLLDFEDGIDADATFLMPGSDDDGFSFSDLTDEGWEHLKMLRG